MAFLVSGAKVDHVPLQGDLKKKGGLRDKNVIRVKKIGKDYTE